VVNVSGRNEVPVPSEHPNSDLLADLAAEVLPDDLAGHVQNHVVSCALCAGLLADAESVRMMLLQIEPAEMPDEVLSRLERALQTARREDEAAAATGGRSADAAETRMLTRLPLGSEGGRTDQTRRIVRAPGQTAPPTGRITATGPMTGSMATGPKTSRLNRMSAPTQSARRQAIEEQKADRPSLLSRLSPVLRIAAAVLVLGGAGFATLQLRGDGASSSDSGVAASGEVTAAPAVIAPVQSTKTDYAKKALPSQVKTLIANSQKLLSEQDTLAAPPAAAAPEAGGKDSATDPTPTSAAASDKAVGPKAAASPSALVQQGQLLRSPEALQACLNAIGAAQVQPVAVDLARYAGREAAIIVLPADGGGYDVWVVARDCRADSDGAIDVVTVKP
jgi:hypothetical protein